MSGTRIEIAPYAPELKSEWDRIVLESNNGVFLHRRDFIEYHAHRFDERSVLVLLDGRPAFAFPCTRHGEEIVSHGGLTFGGLIHGMDMRAGFCREVVAALKDHYRAGGAGRIVYKAVPHIYHRYPAEEDLYALFQEGARLVRRDIASAILMAERPGFAKGRLDGVRKGRKRGFEVREGEFHEAFFELLSGTLKKFGASPVHSLEELERLKSRFPENIRLFGAFLGEDLHAAAWVFDHGRVAHTQYLCTSEEGRRSGALDHLIHDLLETRFATTPVFSFGISTEDAGRHLNAGLVHQKEGFGGRGIVHDFYELPL